MGDVIAVQGKPVTVGVKIVDFDKGQVRVKLPSGRLVQRNIADVQYLRITGWETFNEAEKLHRDGKLQSAADHYEKLLDPRDAVGVIRYDRQQLVRCRLLQVYNVLGRFDRAVELYVAIVQEMPECLETLRPRKLPAADSSFLESAVRHIDSTIARHPSDKIGKSLTEWRNTWPGIEPLKAVSPTASKQDPKPNPVRKEIAPIAQLVKEQQFNRSLERIETLLTPQAGHLRADLYYWQGRALMGKAKGQDTKDMRRAGLALMRVVIHYPDHPLAAECLYTAGTLCHQTGRDEAARRLWSELINDYSKATQWVSRARQDLKKLEAPTSRPAEEIRSGEAHES
jgi:tetratricopeptide (TPR) repeat protein